MTMVQYEIAWQHYNELLKKQVEADVLDSPPPDSRAFAGVSEAITSLLAAGPQTDLYEPASTAEAPSEGPYATPQQLARLKLRARQVGDEASADVQDLLEHHQEWVPVGVYEDIMQRLKARKAAKKEDTIGER
jgi:hypothetical protein